jgi:hypothetical protein
MGVDPNFWELGSILPATTLGDEQLVLNRSLADQLKVQIGDRVTLKVSRDAVVPADSALGKRDTEVVALSRWQVVDIVPDESLGRFSLRSDQRPVLNAYASKESLQKALEIEGQINAVASSMPDSEPLLPTLQLSLEDLGLRWERVQRVFPEKSIGESLDQEIQPGTEPVSVFDYDQLTSQQMMIPDALADAFSDFQSRLVPEVCGPFGQSFVHLRRAGQVDEHALKLVGFVPDKQKIDGVILRAFDGAEVSAGRVAIHLG